jgi:hypothetical protein
MLFHTRVSSSEIRDKIQPTYMKRCVRTYVFGKYLKHKTGKTQFRNTSSAE